MNAQPLPKHDTDFYGWTIQTARFLRERMMDKVDFDNVIEEIEALGRSNRRELISRFGVLIAHLMKLHYQPTLPTKSWKGTIIRQRIDITDLLEENPSLKSQVDYILPKAYKYALSILEEETPLEIKRLPQECPYIFEQIVDEGFYPAGE